MSSFLATARSSGPLQASGNTLRWSPCSISEAAPMDIDSVAIHPRNAYLAVSEFKSHDIVLLSTADGSEIRRLDGHQDIVLH